MAKNKGKSKGKQKAAKPTNDGASEIRRAEARLASALAEVDVAREKVSRRERELATLLERHGVTASAETIVDDAIPLEAPAQPVSENGATDSEASDSESEPVKVEITDEPPVDSGEQHE